MAGHNIHVLPAPLTAFRIRDGHANASAPSPETRLRSAYESVKILERFADFTDDLFREVFDAESVALQGRGWSVPRRVAELARTVDRIDHRHFALDFLFRIPRSPEDFARLRDWGGCLDALNQRALEERENRIGELHQAIVDRDQTLAHLAEMIASYDRQIAEAGRDTVERAAKMADLEIDSASAMAGTHRSGTARTDVSWGDPQGIAR
jgi:hypothetical protein